MCWSRKDTDCLKYLSVWKFRYAGLIFLIADGSVTTECRTSKVMNDVLLRLLWGSMKDSIKKEKENRLQNVVSVSDASDDISKKRCCSFEVWLYYSTSFLSIYYKWWDLSLLFTNFFHKLRIRIRLSVLLIHTSRQTIIYKLSSFRYHTKSDIVITFNILHNVYVNL